MALNGVPKNTTDFCPRWIGSGYHNFANVTSAFTVPRRPHRYPHGEAPALPEKAIHPLGKNRRGKLSRCDRPLKIAAAGALRAAGGERFREGGSGMMEVPLTLRTAHSHTNIVFKSGLLVSTMTVMLLKF